jgi:hypothetical protein
MPQQVVNIVLEAFVLRVVVVEDLKGLYSK